MSKTDVIFQRGTLDEINSTDKVDGQILLTTDLGLNNKMFTDVKKPDGTIERIRIAGTNDVDTSFDETSTNPLMNKEVSSWVRSMAIDLNSTQEKNTAVANTLNDIKNSLGEYKILWQRDKVADDDGYSVYPNAIGTGETGLRNRTKDLPQVYSLSEKISEQKQGIIILFSDLDIDYHKASNPNMGQSLAFYKPQDYHFISRFVHKKEVELFPGAGHSFLLIGSNTFSWSSTALHYLYINDEQINDNVYNLFDCANATQHGSYWTNKPVTGTNGIQYSNSKFCIRAILGV